MAGEYYTCLSLVQEGKVSEVALFSKRQIIIAGQGPMAVIPFIVRQASHWHESGGRSPFIINVIYAIFIVPDLILKNRG